MSVGDRIRAQRKKMKVSLTRLAEDANTSQGYLSDLENGKVESPTSTIIGRIAVVLNTTSDYLLGLSDDPVPPNTPRPKRQTSDEHLAYLEGQFREAGYTEHDIALIMPVLKRLAPPAKSDE